MVWNPDPDSYLQGSLSERPSWQLPVGTPAWHGKIDAEQQEEARKRAANAGGGADSGGGGLFGLVFLPPLVPPGYVVYLTWQSLTLSHWHIVFRLLVAAMEIYAMGGALLIVGRFLPRFAMGVLFALYIAACYGAALSWMGAHDYWLGGGTALTGLGGFFIGRWIHDAGAASRANPIKTIRGFIVAALGAATVFSSLVLAVMYIAALALGWALLQSQQRYWTTAELIAGGVAWVVFQTTVPWMLLRALARYLPASIAAPVFMAMMAAAAYPLMKAAGLDPVWTWSGVVAAGLGGIYLPRTLA
jgi:hypothetical protein